MGFDLNGAIAGKVAGVLSLLDIPWPGGDPAKLRDLASEWRSASTQLNQITSRLDGQVKAVVGPVWEGSAADAFATGWATQHQAMQTTADNFTKVADQLDSYADEAEEIIEEIVDIALQIAEMELAGAVLTFVTAGLSDLLSNAATAERVGKLGELVARFINLAERAETKISKLLDTFQKKGLVRKFLVDSAKNTATNLAGTQLSNVMSGQGTVGLSDLKTAGIGGLVGAAAGATLDKAAQFTHKVHYKGRHTMEANEGHSTEAPSKIAQVLDGRELAGAPRVFQQMGANFVTGAVGSASADVAQRKDTSHTVWDTAVGGVGGLAGAGIVRGIADTGHGAHAKAEATEVPLPFDMGTNTAVGGQASALQNALQEAPKQTVSGAGTEGAVEVPE